MSKQSDFSSNDYLFTVHNMCGEYSVSMPYSLEQKLSYIVQVSVNAPEKEGDTPPEKALPYLQEICDKASRENWDLDVLRDNLEKFGDPHYNPIPWEQEALPSGALE